MRTKRRAKTQTLAILILLFLAILANESQRLPHIPPVNAQPSQAGSPAVAITPDNITDLSKKRGSTFSVNVTLSNAPHLNSFEVLIFYNSRVLIANSVDSSQGILGSNAKVVVYCINGAAPANTNNCITQDKYDQQSEVAFGMNTLSGWTDNITKATLFQINFTVNATGVGQIHLFSAQLGIIFVANNVGGPLPPVTVQSLYDGFFSNQQCGTRACQHPTVIVNYSPNPVPKNQVASFNASVTDPNAGAKLVSDLWIWNDGSESQTQVNSTVPGAVPPYLGQLMTHEFLASRFGLYTACVGQGLCLVTLTVTDSLGISWEVNVPVIILVLNIVLSVGGPDINPQHNVLPGTLVKISALIVNSGNIPENATLTIKLDTNKTLGARYFPSVVAVGGQGALNATWDTAGFTPRAYAITAEITNNTGIANDKITHALNATSRPSATSYVILVSPVITGAISLSILQTAGLGILILVAAVIAVARLFRKPSYLEPL
jgi:Cohesin domain